MQLKAKIRNLAQKNHIPAQAVLQNFMLERLLERIALSRYKDQIILKGGMLVAALVGISSRTTMDMDTTLRGYPLSGDSIRQAVLEICAIPLEDGVTFTWDHILPIREEDEYGGYRVAVQAHYESILIPLKVDITTGDVITPGAIRYIFQSNFGDQKIEVWAYNVETILAEKVETILRRGLLNTRSRDFYDVYILAKTQQQSFSRAIFLSALKATAERRMSLIALDNKAKILGEIQSDVILRQRWNQYCRENYYANEVGFDEVIAVLREILDTVDGREEKR